MSIFNSLKGGWSFRREIINHIDNRSSGIVTGFANFVSIDNQENNLNYKELGKFLLHSGLSFNISNEYFFVFDEKSHIISKYTAINGIMDKKLYSLHDTNTATHDCGNDKYYASYDFFVEKNNEFCMSYEVFGPRKKYSSCTKYIRLLEQ